MLLGRVMFYRWCKVVAGLRQGCPLSPVLYSVYVMEMLKDLEAKRLGIEVERTWCGGLLYAGNTVLLARDQVELQVMLDVVGKYVKWRFRFNSKKSKTVMVGGKCSGGKRRLMRREWKMWKYSSILECGRIEGREEMYIWR